MKKSPLRKFLLAMIAILTLSLLATNFVKRNQFVDTGEKKFYGFFSMVRYSLFDYPSKTFSNFVQDYATFWDRRNENDALRQQLVAASDLNRRVKQLEKELESLKTLNDINSLYSDFDLVSARVKSRSFDSWDQELILDVGRNQGVSVDDGVVALNGLVGRVVHVEDTYSIVSLLTSNESFAKVSVSFNVGDVEVNGIIDTYNFASNSYDIRILNGEVGTEVGTEVHTSGLGGVFPRGLYIGKITKVENTSEEVLVRATVASEVNYNKLDYVKVVHSK